MTGGRMRALLRMWVVAAAAVMAAARPAGAQWTREGRVLVGQLEHRVDAGFGAAASTGTVLGVAASFGRAQVVEVEAHALGGRLAADAVARDDRTVGEIGVRAAVLPLPWLAVGATAMLRGHETAPARQRWTLVGADAELRLAFADGRLRTRVQGALLPHVRISGQDAPDLGVATTTGVQLVHRRLSAAVEYRVERYLFPDDPTGPTRREQLAGLLLRLGASW